MVAKKVVSQNKAVFTKMTIKGETARLESIWISNFCPNITCSQRSSSLWCTLKTHIVKHKCNPFNSSSHLWGSVDVSVCKQHLNPEPLRQQSESSQGSLLSDLTQQKTSRIWEILAKIQSPKKWEENWGSLHSHSNPAKGNHTKLQQQNQCKFCFQEEENLTCYFMGLGCPNTNSEGWLKGVWTPPDSATPADGSSRKFNIYI